MIQCAEKEIERIFKMPNKWNEYKLTPKLEIGHGASVTVVQWLQLLQAAINCPFIKCNCQHFDNKTLYVCMYVEMLCIKSHNKMPYKGLHPTIAALSDVQFQDE